MLRVKVIQKNPNLYKLYGRQVKDLSKKHTYVLAKETERIIKEKIRENTKRPGSTGLLADSFKTYETEFGHGVGKIDYLNKEAVFWRHVNYGSVAIGANWKHFVPKGQFQPGNPQPNSDSFRDGRWVKGGKYGFIPTKPIPPMNYIEKTLTEILPKIHYILRKTK